MANLIKEDSIFAAVEESSEGTLASPASATDGYIQLKRDGVAMKSSRDLKERNVFTGTLADADPRMGMKGGEGTFPCEMKASGTEGSTPDYGVLIESILPTKTTISGRNTSKVAGNTGSILQIEDADIAEYSVNDFIVVLESGAYHPCFITARATGAGVAAITVSPAKASGVFSNSVVISKSITYKPADTGHKSYSAIAYWGSGASGGGIREAILGARTKTLSVEGFDTGELAQFKFDFEGLSWAYTAATDAGYTPTFDSSLPPVVLSCGLYKDGTTAPMKDFSMSIEQPLAFLKSVTSASGKTTGRAAGTRKIKGKIKPYVDGTAITNFTAWEAGTSFALIAWIAVPHSTTVVTLGSVVGIYMPHCVITQPTYGNEDGVMTEEIEFQATGGVTGADNSEIVIGFV